MLVMYVIRHSVDQAVLCDIDMFIVMSTLILEKCVCYKAFTQKSSLIKHKRQHSVECSLSCDMCNSEKTSLIKHKHMHSGKRPYICVVCNKAFSQKRDLVTHQHLHCGEHPYNCDVRNRAFSEKSSLIKHQRIHTGECLIRVIFLIRHSFSRAIW